MGDIRFINLEYFFNAIYEFFIGLGNPDGGFGFFLYRLFTFLKVLFNVIIPICILILIILWVYYHIRFIELRRYDKDKIHARLLKRQQAVVAHTRNARWEQVKELFNSTNESDWRLAIIESDSMLEDVIVKMGYVGDNLGERLKNIDKGDFPALDAAWEAHLVRNKIAHEGLNYQLTERDKKRVHKLYETVFTTAGYI